MAKPDMTKHHKYFGVKMIVVGILIILNAIYSWFDWAVFVGGIFVVVANTTWVVLALYYKKKQRRKNV